MTARAALLGGILSGLSAGVASGAAIGLAAPLAEPAMIAPPTARTPRSMATIDGVEVTPSAPPFAHGETLTFEASWNRINVGQATMTVDTGGTFEGRPAIHLKASAKSNRAFSLFFSIKDAGESWVDPVGLYSLGFVSDQKEGSIDDLQRWVIDNDRGIATRHRVRQKGSEPAKKGTKEFPMTATHVQDAFSMLYYFRAFDLKVGQKLVSDVFVSRKVWTLEVEAIGKERVKTPAGTFDCLKVKPRVTLNGVEQKKGQMTIWVTEDARRMPVKIQSDIPLGKINAVLHKFTEGQVAEAAVPAKE